jgi:hypothetical protein
VLGSKIQQAKQTPHPSCVRFYEDDMFLIEAVASFVKLGLQVNDTLIVKLPTSHRPDLLKLLTPDEFASAHLMFFDIPSLLSKIMGDDWPNQPKFIKVLGTLIQKSCQPAGLRMLREMLAGLWAEGKYLAAIRLEELWNTLQTMDPFSRLHAYSHSAFTSKEDPQSLRAESPAHAHVHRDKTGTSPPCNRYVVAAVVSLPSSLYIRNPRLLLCFAREAPH